MNEDVVLLVDVDNTLLNNDDVRIQLEAAVTAALGPERGRHFWGIYEAVRAELDFVSFPDTLNRFGPECDDLGCLAELSEILYHFPFHECLYPTALDALAHLKTMGRTVILSDGDQLFQRYKIRRAGIEAAVDRNVLVYVHKEHERDDIRRRFPASHYVIFDDKPRIHAGMKRVFGSEITTVLVRQGSYAAAASTEDPPPDLSIDSITDVLSLDGETLVHAARS